MTDTELTALHSRMFALEKPVTALLATATEDQLEIARDMAAFITPHVGLTRDPLTIRSAAPMVRI